MKTNKHFLLTLLFIVASIGLNAAPISREQAKVNAQSFLQKVKGSRALAPVQSRAKLGPRRAKATTPETELYYIFNRGEQQGYIIVSGDDRTPAILGYTDSGEFDYEQLPVNMRSWLERREMQLEALSLLPESEAPRKASTHDAIAPMVTTHWNQGAPYNDECPMYFTLGRSITGCVATAMAQVLYYQRAKSVREVQADIPAYETWTSHETYGKLHVEGIEAGSPIDWDNMLDSYGSSATAKQKLAVAQLMHYCGVAVHMDYTNSSSGAQSSEVSTAFQKYFGYGSSTRYVQAANYSNEQWDNLIYNELAEGRPLYLSGANSEAGHAFVCDGYDGNGCFHINWGWGGQSDGYFMLTKLNPSSQGLGGSDGGYSDYEDAVIGCEPDNYMEMEMPIANAIVKRLCLDNWDTNADGKFSYGEAASVTNLGDVFKGQAITTFAELYYFTSLESIADDAFADCTRLNTVKLPKGLKSIGNRSFANCKLLKTFKLPDNLTAIGDSAFAGCRVLPNLALPLGLKRIEANTFEGCIAMTETELPLGIQFIGTKAFSGCTKMLTVTVKSVNPEQIELGETVFEGIDLSKATLETLQGTHSYFATADQWKEFGNLHENRTLAAGNYATLATNTKYFLYNVGTGYYMTKGEAWGTQAIVANTDSPMRFEFRRSSTMPDGVYYLYSNDTGNASNHILFRTSNDDRVGTGIPTCFVDGPSSHITDKTSYWNVQLVEGKDNVYTLQIPSGQTGYKATQYLGVQPSHESNAATPTYGLYSDIVYNDYTYNCHWMLVPYDAAEAENFQRSLILKNLLQIASLKKLDTTQEQAIYDNFESTTDEIDTACRRLRRKLNFINFVDEATRPAFVAVADADDNGEVSYTEASQVQEIGSEFYQNTNITDLSDLKYLTNLPSIYGNTFQGCTKLETVILPLNLVNIYYRAFMGCSKLKSIYIDRNVKNIGDDTFSGCTKLQEVRIAVHDPAAISLGSNVFNGVKTSTATLYVPQGSKELYEKADVWKTFGTIKEMRAVGRPQYEEPQVNTNYYVYNVGLKGSINAGESWGTQAVIASNGFPYQLRHSSNMPDGIYYLYSPNAANDKTLFRTSTDSKTGVGVKTCFTDGSLSAKTYWKLERIEGDENLYTLQVPTTDAEYVEGEYLGTDYYHHSSWGTNGLYYDIKYADNPQGCQWAFISVDAVKKAEAFYDLTEQLRDLLERADAVPLECAEEHAVYDDFESSEEQINDAIASLRGKLHYIDFLDTRARTLCTQRWDTNEDNELSLEEAAAVTDIGTVFRTSTALKSFEELRHFTSITEIPAEAFRGCSSLTSIYIPENVTTIGEKAFYTTTALKYMAVLSPTLIDASSASLPSKLTVFVPASQMEAFTADDTWGKCSIKEYTGTPVVTADDASRIYGRTISNFTFDVTGAPVNGEPALSCEADATSPVGTYTILCEAGGITSKGAQFVNGTLTVEGAPLTLAAKSYTRNIGEENPEFQFTNSTLKNREKIADILITQPVLECDATIDSPAGVYEIRISGAEAANYVITYTNGTLTVIDPVGIHDVNLNDKANEPIYDLAGRKVNGKPTRGLYIVGKKKVRL